MGVEIFLRLTGIPGESLDPGHKSEIELTSWSWASPRRAPAPSPDAPPAPGATICTKAQDIASSVLANYAVTGKTIPDGTLTVTQVGDDETDLIILSMTNIIVVSFKRLSTPEGGVAEQFSLDFDSFTTKSAYHSIGPAPGVSMGYTVSP